MKRLLILICLLLPSLSWGATYTIGSDPSDDYASYTALRAAVTEAAGDTVSFRKGEIFREQVTVPASGSSASAVITYTSHGTGAKPILFCSDDLSSADLWTNESGNLWYATATVKIRNMVFNDATYGTEVTTAKADLDVVGEFWWDTTTSRVYLYSESNPGSAYTNIEATKDITAGINGTSRTYITVNGIEINHCKTGIVAGSNWNILNNTIRWSYATGVNIPNSSATVLVSGNTIRYSGGVTISKTSYAKGVYAGTGVTALTITGNTIVQNTYGQNSVHIVGATSPIVTNNNISGGDAAIVAAGDCPGMVVTGNTIHDIGIMVGSVGADGVGLYGDNSIVANNIITQNAEPVLLVGAVEFMGGANTCTDTEVYGNTISGAYMSRWILGGGSAIKAYKNKVSIMGDSKITNFSGSVITYNDIHLTGTAAAIGLDADSNAPGARAITVYNNTFTSENPNAVGIQFKETSGTWSASTLLKNNIFQGFSKGVVVDDKDSDGVAVVHEYNLYYSNTEDIQKNVSTTYTDIELSTGEGVADPKLTSPTNFHLLPGSPAINGGVDVGLTSDIEGRTVPQELLPDIGAYEYIKGQHLRTTNPMHTIWQ